MQRLREMNLNKTIPDVVFLSVVMILNPRQGVSVIITDRLPEIYLLNCKVVGRIGKKSGKFSVHLVYPLDGYPHLNDREAGHLAQALNAAATVQLDMPVSAITGPMIQVEGVDQLPRRMLRMSPGS